MTQTTIEPMTAPINRVKSGQPFWKAVAPRRYGAYVVAPMNSAATLVGYSVGDAMPDLKQRLAEALGGGVKTFAVLDAVTGVVVANVPVHDQGHGYLPGWHEIATDGQADAKTFYDLAELLAKELSLRDYGHDSAEDIARYRSFTGLA